MFHILVTRLTKVRWCWLARERGTSTASPLVSTVLVLRVATLGGCRNPARCGTPCTCALWNTTKAGTSLRCSSESRGLTGSNWAGGSGGSGGSAASTSRRARRWMLSSLRVCEAAHDIQERAAYSKRLMFDTDQTFPKNPTLLLFFDRESGERKRNAPITANLEPLYSSMPSTSFSPSRSSHFALPHLSSPPKLHLSHNQIPSLSFIFSIYLLLLLFSPPRRANGSISITLTPLLPYGNAGSRYVSANTNQSNLIKPSVTVDPRHPAETRENSTSHYKVLTRTEDYWEGQTPISTHHGILFTDRKTDIKCREKQKPNDSNKEKTDWALICSMTKESFFGVELPAESSSPCLYVE
ncbi:hypothetical protein GWK47_015115 [Chionoecetes opilio]|uniref:Uncharacterized protein n=1 Tax=Chionoecetes opilio TaxID=41210 RepID=A0A8J5C002_CHIOP|nr:hypothetical protein GWK47_015115 [Chionoecetes opilio]